MAKLTPFDYFAWRRPFPDRWPYIAANQMSELLAAGGYRMKWIGTPYNAALGGNGAASVDYYLNVIPGSYVWAVGVWDNPNFAFTTVSVPNVPVGVNADEIEIIDTSTREAWFESSQDSSNLGAWNFSDNLTVYDSGLAANITEQMGFYYNMWMLQQPRLILGNGVQRVRVVQNSSQSNNAQNCWIVLYVCEPISGGVLSGL